MAIEGRLIGVDYGERRIGIAVSDPMGIIASPLLQITHHGVPEAVDRLAELIQNEEAIGVVVGEPRHLGGGASKGVTVVREIASRLAARTGLPVWLWDERLSTVAAASALREGGMKGPRLRQRLDAVAAALILQTFLDAHRERPLPPAVDSGPGGSAQEGAG